MLSSRCVTAHEHGRVFAAIVPQLAIFLENSPCRELGNKVEALPVCGRPLPLVEKWAKLIGILVGFALISSCQKGSTCELEQLPGIPEPLDGVGG